MISNKIKLPIVLCFGLASFICYCIALGATGTTYGQVTAVPFMEIEDNGVHTYYDLMAVSESYKIGDTTYTHTTLLSDLCGDDNNNDYTNTCNECVDVSIDTIAMLTVGFFTCVCAMVINIIQFFNSSFVLIYIAAIFMFISWVMALAAFANYEENCYQVIYDKSYVHGLSHGNGFNATVTAFVFMFITFILNFIRGGDNKDSNGLNTTLINDGNYNSSVPPPPPV